MDKASAKKLACRYASVALELFNAADFLSTPDKLRLEMAMKSLVEELSRRAGEFSTLPLDLPGDIMVAATNGSITIDGNEQTVTIHSLGETFHDTEKIASVLVPLEEKYDFALVFVEVTDVEK